MRHLKKAGLLSSLSIIGVLGGLIAPLPSESSSTSLTLQVDNGSPVSILGGTGACPSGYNQCFSITSTPQAFGNNGRAFRALAAPGTSSTGTKLLINDTAASDAFKFTGIQIAPTSTSSWPNTETHVVKIVMTNTFDANPNGSGNYVVALRTGGYLKAAGTSPIYTQYDWLEFKGTGTFSPSLVNVNLLNTANPTPLKLQVGNQATATYFTLNQVVAYPTFGCDADGTGPGTQCKPVITLTMTVTFYGPDSLVLTDSSESIFGGPCKLTPADSGVTEPTGNPIPCHAEGKKKNQDEIITGQINTGNTTDVTESQQAGAVAYVQCTEADNCPCADPDACFGTIVINLKVTPGTAGTFNVTGTGGGLGNPTPETPTIYPIVTRANGRGSITFDNLPTVIGGPWVIAEGPFPPIDSGHFWETDQIGCVSKLNDPEAIPPIIVTTWTINSGPDKSPLTVTQLGGGDTLTCGWHLHQANSN